MDLHLKPIPTAAGVGLAVVLDRTYVAIGSPEVGPVEHSHIGLAALISGLNWKHEGCSKEDFWRLKCYRSTAIGFGAALIAEDLFYGNVLGLNVGTSQDRKFSLGLDAIEIGILVAKHGK
jgi:hypothetical protein